MHTAISFFFVVQFTRGAVAFVAASITTGRLFRFRPLQTAASGVDGCAIAGLELMLDGFPLPGGNVTCIASEAAMTVEFPVAVPANGWRISTLPAAATGVQMDIGATAKLASACAWDVQDGLEFVVEASNDGADESWTRMTTRQPDPLYFQFYARDAGRTTFELPPGGGGAVAVYDLRPDWHFVLDTMLVPILDVCIMLGLGAAGAAGEARRGPWIVALPNSVQLLAFAASAAGYTWVGRVGASAALWILAGGKVLWATVPVLAERRIWPLFVVHGLIVVSADLTEDASRSGSIAGQLLGAPPVFGVSEILLWLSIASLQVICDLSIPCTSIDIGFEFHAAFH